MNVLFYGKNVDECLKAAESELGIKKENLDYKVVKKSGIFNKVTTIEVRYDLDFTKSKEEIDDKKQKQIKEKDNVEKEDEELLKIIDETESGIMVKDGLIKIISNSVEAEVFKIRSCRGINLYINDVKCDREVTYNVNQFDNLRYVEEKTEPQDNLIKNNI